MSAAGYKSLESRGVTDWQPVELPAVTRTLAELRAAGHAVLLDSTTDHRGTLVQVRVHHYLTCKACAQ